jgi:hypothetical protein
MFKSEMNKITRIEPKREDSEDEISVKTKNKS